MFTGNRGCLVDASGDLVRHHRGNLWITCLTSFRDWRHPLDEPRTWTPLFFLDDGVALAAGHRPCGLCRPDAYTSFRDALTRALGRDEPLRAVEMNQSLAVQRLGLGSGIDRAGDRKLWTAPFAELPDGAVVVDDVGEARLVVDDRTLAFRHCGWRSPRARPTRCDARVLTPPTSVAALRHGFDPVLHPSSRS
jgi:hypothetical protein